MQLFMDSATVNGTQEVSDSCISSDLPFGARSVMASRAEPPNGLDYFPTPPWATRALIEHVLAKSFHPAASPDVIGFRQLSIWEPACGEGHMIEVLREYFGKVHASDIHDYGRGYEVGSFVGEGSKVAFCSFNPDWIITNPPYNLALQFAIRALSEAKSGVAFLVRTNWLEGARRYNELFEKIPPDEVALFSERVPMVKGRWDPKASTATAYAWVIWRKPSTGETRLQWIPPGQRKKLSRPGDVDRFATRVISASRDL
ncbi:conserved protein of unknown function [Candidatus Filomicrobium marinum]|uniref:Methyltransferase n=3 Tax=Candidatus Filomicrobium marinum TaxID=1608628 RepID=A0A0D6JK48_9HYPH|nr:conserved protein of unknown function [Candidatus Filomicrobium marinum]CPR22364.1 conserved protein of unknown function [Candidatus Filomicrobium marinum]